MNESQLYRYALLSCCIGFIALFVIVFFIPVSFSEDDREYIDGMVVNSFPSSSGGEVVIISVVDEKSLYFEESVSLLQGSMYRFYEPSGDDLLFVSDFRKLS